MVCTWPGTKKQRCEKFVPALAYQFCLALPGSCLARFTDLFWDLCMRNERKIIVIRSFMMIRTGEKYNTHLVS